MMKHWILSALLFCGAMVVNAGELYRWADPESGQVMMTPTLPPYPIKGTQEGGSLPNGPVLKVIFDENAPLYKAAIAKRKAAEDERRKAAEASARARAEQEAKAAAEKAAKEKAAKEAAAREQEAMRMANEAAAKAAGITPEQNAAINEACASMRGVAQAAAKAKTMGIPLRMALAAAIPKDAVPLAADMVGGSVRAVYQQNLVSPGDEEIVVAGCRLSILSRIKH